MSESGCSYSQPVAFLCSLGLFLAGYLFYSSSQLQPFYTNEFHLTSWEVGIVQSSVPLGAIFGALVAGRLADLFGRHSLLNWNFLAVAGLGIMSAVSIGFFSLCAIRFLNGFFAGTLYPLCATYLIEMTPSTMIARKSALLMFINCLAAPIAGAITILLANVCESAVLWRVLSCCHSLPALVGYIWCRKLPESREWLVLEKQLLNKNNSKGVVNFIRGLSILFTARNKTVTLCLMGTWFLMDVAYYGVNFFLPFLLSTIEDQTWATSNTTLWNSFVIQLCFLIGAFAAIYVVDKMELVRLQKFGFLFSGLSLCVLALYLYFGLNQNYTVILFFILFNFAINVGPDVTTYLLSGISYPVNIRATAHGLLAGFAKFGSFLGVLLLPPLQEMWGCETVIFFMAILLFAACGLTVIFAKATSVEPKLEEDKIIYETN